MNVRMILEHSGIAGDQSEVHELRSGDKHLHAGNMESPRSALQQQGLGAPVSRTSTHAHMHTDVYSSSVDTTIRFHVVLSLCWRTTTLPPPFKH